MFQGILTRFQGKKKSPPAYFFGGFGGLGASKNYRNPSTTKKQCKEKRFFVPLKRALKKPLELSNCYLLLATFFCRGDRPICRICCNLTAFGITYAYIIPNDPRGKFLNIIPIIPSFN